MFKQQEEETVISRRVLSTLIYSSKTINKINRVSTVPLNSFDETFRPMLQVAFYVILVNLNRLGISLKMQHCGRGHCCLGPSAHCTPSLGALAFGESCSECILLFNSDFKIFAHLSFHKRLDYI